jgi:dihydroorotate dehydrogenase (fumarate)
MINNKFIDINRDDIDISTTIGNIKFNTPFINASGCWSKTYEELYNMDICQSGAYITKTMTIQPRSGNPEPRLYYDASLSINSMGLPNLGYSAYLEYAINTSNRNKPLFFSISHMNIKDTKKMLSMTAMKLQDTKIKGIEFNISCPNIIGKGQIGNDMEQFRDFLNMISESKIWDIPRDDLAIGLKMSPYFEKTQFEQVAALIKEYPRLDFITCINGIGGGMVVDIETERTCIQPNGGCGGLGGSIVKPTGLANTKTFKSLLGDKIDIIGCGGISTGADAFEYILAGASACAVGTQILKETPIVFGRLNQELISIMEKKKYNSIYQFKNKINIIEEQTIKNKEVSDLLKQQGYDLSYAMC